MIRLQRRNPREKGQVLPLFAMVSLVLISMLALVVDGGLSYAERRSAQNAADATAAAASLTLLKQDRGKYTDQAQLLADMEEAARRNGIGQGAASLGDLLEVRYLDENGSPIGNCIIGDGSDPNHCSDSVAQDAFGVHVVASSEFQGFFAGMIGMNTLRVSGDAFALVRRRASRNGQGWAAFATGGACTGNVMELEGLNTDFYGHLHSNQSAILNANLGTVFGDITFASTCNGSSDGSACPSTGTNDQLAAFNIEIPEYEEYREVADTQSGLGLGERIIGDVTVGNGQSRAFGSVTPELPFTYIDGDLFVDAGATVSFYGLIVVTGNIDIHGTAINSTIFTMVAGDVLWIHNNATGLSGSPYQAASSLYGPLMETNVVKFFSNGTGICTRDTLEIDADNLAFNGTLLAPNGRIDIDGTMTIIQGGLVARTIEIESANSDFNYNQTYFLPQSDFIEMVR